MGIGEHQDGNRSRSKIEVSPKVIDSRQVLAVNKAIVCL